MGPYLTADDAKHFWYQECVERSCRHEMGSFGYVFWWSLRYELSNDEHIRKWAHEPEEANEEWLGYLLFKWEQLEPHRSRNT